MAPKFGTSGLRGLVVDLTSALIAEHVQAFLTAFPNISELYLGRDLRPSSPRIAGDVAMAARKLGITVIDCGAVPTPALALTSLGNGGGAIMVTGSHIPADRNGLKFYTTGGEISKADEQAILEQLEARRPPSATPADLRQDHQAGDRFCERYLTAFGSNALSGLCVGLYAHSSVGRDLLSRTLSGMGADIVELGRSDQFIPVDTEAVDAITREKLAAWAKQYKLNAIVSMDGDADRPLLTDETGTIIPGDILGQITSSVLGAKTVVTPVSSNSGAEAGQRFKRVLRTKIGSPYVIAAMAEAGGKVVGYEANGGYLLGFDALGPKGLLKPLWTRDSFLPLIVPLTLAQEKSLSEIAAAEPGGVTAATRLQDTPTDLSQRLVQTWIDTPKKLQTFLNAAGAPPVEGTDLTDGLRLYLEGAEVIHIRPSGNAPELRLYVEAANAARADRLLMHAADALRQAVAGLEAGQG